MHPFYDSTTQAYDFAILKLKEIIQFDNKVNAACLPSDDSQTFALEELIVSGWGNIAATGHSDEFPSWLQVCLKETTNYIIIY